MGVLEHIQPKRVMYYFEEVSKIPHGSKNTKEISDYLVSIAAANPKLKYRQDELGNVIIWKEGSKGSENKPPVILQGHMDMVCDKDPDIDIDMDKDPLQLRIIGDEIKATGTTLGGDDGIAIAMALAILEDDSLKTPPIEAIFTVDEEIGMLGAAGIDVSDIKGRTFINIDSEAEGYFTVSCAGGTDATCILPANYAEATGLPVSISISGLIGGHSGVEINRNRANASILLGRVLNCIEDEGELLITDIRGGAKSNAIPAYAQADLLFVGGDANVCDIKKSIEQKVSDIAECLREEYKLTDPGLRIECSAGKEDVSARALDNITTKKLIYMLTCLPNGVQRMSPANPDFVQTSLNLGIVEKTKDSIIFTYCVRSSVDSEKEDLKNRLRIGMEIIGGEVQCLGDYPGWVYRKESPLRDICVKVYKELYGREPVIEAIHAGLECGYFADKLPGLDCVSLGPDMKDIHTSRESISISSVERVYKMLLKILEELA